MSDLNCFSGTGRLTKDAELKYTSSGSPLSVFTLAIGEKYKDKQKTTFIDCTLFGVLAEKLNQYLQKGKQVAILAKLDQQTWEKDGQRHQKICLIINDINLIGGNQQTGQPQKSQQSNATVPQQGQDDGFEDEIPF